MQNHDSHVHLPSRRRFLAQAGMGLGSLALASLLHEESHGQTRQPHHAPKVRSVIWLFMTGGPSQVDTFDYKPKLQTDAGKRVFGRTLRDETDKGFYLVPSPFVWTLATKLPWSVACAGRGATKGANSGGLHTFERPPAVLWPPTPLRPPTVLQLPTVL